MERHFIKELEANEKYRAGKYEDALRETFLKLDVLLANDDGKREITAIQK